MRISLCHGYEFTLYSVEKLDVALPDVVQDSFSPAYGYIELQDGVLTMGNKEGYCWDGSSIPLKGFLRFVSFKKFDADRYSKEASLFHDGLYQLIRLDLVSKSHKEYVDGLYKEGCINGGMSKREASIRLWFLKKLGFVGLKKKKHPKGSIFEV